MNFNKISKITILFIVVHLVYAGLRERKWESSDIIEWDVLAYYAYIPAVIIHDDITLSFISSDPEKYSTQFLWVELPDGTRVIKTTMGMSILYAPFVLANHYWFCKEEAKNGFSPTYHLSLLLASIFYVTVGLFFLRKVLLMYFNEMVTSITIVAIVLGTNLYHYITVEAGMSHAYNFSLFCILIYCTVKWYIKPSFWVSIGIGFLLGIIVLIRPTNILMALIFMLWNVKNTKDFKQRIALFLENWKLISLIVGMAFLVWVPQFLYWKSLSGNFFFFSYVGERFYFGDPQIIKGLFSYRKGWFVYTPMALLAILGIYFLRKIASEWILPICIYLALNIYVVLSWWSWWYGGSFGLRAFIDSQAILSLPLAALISVAINKRIVGFGVLFIILSFISLNIFQTYQYSKGIIHWNAMSEEHYWKVFLRQDPLTVEEQRLDPLPLPSLVRDRIHSSPGNKK